MEEWKLMPDQQGWWWHFQGEDYRPAFMYSIMKSGTNGEFFIGYPDSRWCRDLGGFWLYAEYPNVPSREKQAELNKKREQVAPPQQRESEE